MIINTHDQLKEAVKLGFIQQEMAVAISYRRGEPKMCTTNKSSIWSPYFKTDPDSAWYDYGNLAFIGKKTESLPKAIDWATNKYGIIEWKRNRMGDLVPEIVQAKVPIPKRTQPQPKAKE